MSNTESKYQRFEVRIGGIVVRDDQAWLNAKMIGTITDLQIYSDKNRISQLSIVPVANVDFIRGATELSMYGVALSFDVPGQFWQHSYKQNNIWYADVIKEGKVVKVEL